jgi:hypothetical protein
MFAKVKHSSLLNGGLDKGESFITSKPGPDIIKLFMNGHKKLKCLSLTGLSSLVYFLWVRLGA